jgi:hypothetical protein
MPKLRATGAKTDQLEFANLFDFRGFLRVLLLRVRHEIALITRRRLYRPLILWVSVR